MENSVYQARWLFAPIIAIPSFFVVVGALLN
jgi:hypothetical protein